MLHQPKLTSYYNLNVSTNNTNKNNVIVEGRCITKQYRQKQYGKMNGGSITMKPEEYIFDVLDYKVIYQRQQVIKGTGNNCVKTNSRINFRENTIEDIVQPNRKINGFDYSENFDGKQIINNNIIYINFKCVVGKGGSQTRSLREVYWFIEGQLKVLHKINNIYFANILDGDEAHNCLTKFNYLLALPEYNRVVCNVYVGDLKNYFEWVNNKFK